MDALSCRSTSLGAGIFFSRGGSEGTNRGAKSGGTAIALAAVRLSSAARYHPSSCHTHTKRVGSEFARGRVRHEREREPRRQPRGARAHALARSTNKNRLWRSSKAPRSALRKDHFSFSLLISPPHTRSSCVCETESSLAFPQPRCPRSSPAAASPLWTIRASPRPPPRVAAASLGFLRAAPDWVRASVYSCVR